MPPVRVPLIVPAIGRELQLDELLETLDGLLFTGSPSNVEPHHYRGEPSESGTLHDPHRDETTLPLIPRAVAAGRTGARHLPRLPGDERRLRRLAVAEAARRAGASRSSRGRRAAARGAVRSGARGAARARRACCGAWPAPIAFASIRCTARACASSAPGLAVEARAPDGVIEAFRVDAAPQLCAGAAVAPGVAAMQQSIFARAVRRVRRGLPRENQVIYG